jgi:hypothetical protein
MLFVVGPLLVVIAGREFLRRLLRLGPGLDHLWLCCVLGAGADAGSRRVWVGEGVREGLFSAMI